ncbi:MAG: class I SAM-dependent methyltransferase [Balneolaceae bacterium]
MEWFEEWFDSPLYEWLYADRNEEEAARLALLIEEILPLESYRKLLDLGCGRGRHSLTLAERGYHVTGLDLSEEAIRKAEKKARDRKLTQVSFLTGDMREPLPCSFDAILNLFTSFGYFESDQENRRVLSSVSKMLRPGGIFFMDYLNAARVRTTYDPEGEGEFRGVRYSIRRYIENNTIHKEIIFRGNLVGGSQTYEEKVKLYDLQWFETGFAKEGLELLHTFGDYNGSDFLPRQSPRLVMVARNPG